MAVHSSNDAFRCSYTANVTPHFTPLNHKIEVQFIFSWNMLGLRGYVLPATQYTAIVSMYRKPFIAILTFLPCDAMRCTVFVIVIPPVCLSVCLSVCLAVTLVDCVHMVRPTIMISSPYGSPIILVYGDIKFIPKFEGDHSERGR